MSTPTAREVSLLTSVARTVTTSSEDQNNVDFMGVTVIMNMTAVSGSGSLVLKIQGKDPVSGAYYDILVSAALTSTGTTVLTIAPGTTNAANSVSNLPFPKTWRVTVVAGTSDSMTYTIGAVLARPFLG